MTSYAKTIAPASPGQPSSRQEFKTAATSKDQAAAPRNSQMVTKDRPTPAPRPSSDMALQVDRAVFNARWDEEKRSADKEREARKAAFKQAREVQHRAARSKKINRNR